MNVFAIANVVTMQRRGIYANIPMNVFGIANVVTMQRRIFYANVTMDVFAIANVTTTQRRRNYANIPMNVYFVMIALMVQRRRCCSFDSPGLARNEPTPGEYSQGDSTPSVLSFFCEVTLTMNPFMAD